MAARLFLDDNGYPAQAMDFPTTRQQLGVVVGSAQSAAFQATTKLLRLCSTTRCWYNLALNPTAAATGGGANQGVLLEAGAVEYVPIPPVAVGASWKVAAIRDAADGSLSIGEIG